MRWKIVPCYWIATRVLVSVAERCFHSQDQTRHLPERYSTTVPANTNYIWWNGVPLHSPSTTALLTVCRLQMWHEVAIFEVSPDLVSDNTLNDLRDEGQIGDGAVISRFIWISITFLQNRCYDCSLLWRRKAALLKRCSTHSPDDWQKDINHLT